MGLLSRIGGFFTGKWFEDIEPDETKTPPEVVAAEVGFFAVEALVTIAIGIFSTVGGLFGLYWYFIR